MHNRLEPASSALRLGGAVSSMAPVCRVVPRHREEFLDIHHRAANEVVPNGEASPSCGDALFRTERFKIGGINLVALRVSCSRTIKEPRGLHE